MKIFDCFMYSGEDMLLKLRINELNRFVDKFVISEASYHHDGTKKKLKFNIKNFQEFKNKINYIVVNDQPKNIHNLLSSDDKVTSDNKKILNSIRRDNFQRNQLKKGIEESDNDDLIIISDLDEIPNLNEIKKDEVGNGIIIFKQKMFYYKLNLVYENFVWFGSKATKKKHLKSPQNLRNVKNKKYEFWRIDTFFSNKKYRNIKFINNGGWHFSYLKDAKGVEEKLKSIRHHVDYELNPVGVEQLENMIRNKKLVYNYNLDQRAKNKFLDNEILEILDYNRLPEYLVKNKEKYLQWLN